jgi:peptidyl-prolyl cis-trans isomerase SurA
MMPRLLSRSVFAATTLSVAAVLSPSALAAQAVPAKAEVPAAPQDTVRGLPIDGIAAIVGDQLILVSELMTAVNQARASGAKVESASDLAKLEADMLERLIDAELLVQKAKAEKVEVQDGDIASAVDDQEKGVRKRFKSDAEFKAALKEAGMGTLEEWRKITGDQLARAKIDSIWLDLQKNPQDFELMAKKYSMDGSAELGGDLGWNRRGRMVPEFDRMMFSLNPGVISPIVETAFGFHIIRVDRVQPAEVKARHILVRPQVDSADERRARLLADSVAKAWRAGGSFDSLSVSFHDAASGEDKSIPEYPRSELPEPYRNALEGATLNQILDPFPLPDPAAGVAKFVVAQVTFLDEAGEWTLAEARDRIREQLSEERKMRRLIDNLKKQTYVSVRYDPAKQGGDDR